MVYIYDKDLCRTLPLKYARPMVKDGINVDLYELSDDAYGGSNPNNTCFNEPDYDAVYGLQNISPCQYGAPVYISNPHFFQADPSLIEEVEGLQPDKEKHQTYFKIQPVR